MAQHHQHEVHIEVGFKRVQLFKKKTLGIGSYGKVCRAKCDDLPCAAKLLHETLFDPATHGSLAPDQQHRLPIRRFEKECGYMNTVRHPNIVQCLCIFEDPDTSLPVLLMELMDDSLTHFLDTSLKPVPLHIQLNICHDITLALSHLHSNGIVHRDLSSNNVLLIGNVRAKLSDFGMAKLGDLTHTFTMCPGTDVYMPPESVEDKPIYTEKIDCFSFGVIVVQILTREFPQPNERYKIIEIYHPQIHGRKVKVSVPEIERRENHINLIDSKHPLLEVALECLKDRFDDRPSAQKLCGKIAALKSSPEYKESVEGSSTLEQPPPASIEKESSTLKEHHAEEVQSLKQTIIKQERYLEERNEKIVTIKEESNTLLSQKDVIIANYQMEVKDLEEELRQCRNEAERVSKQTEDLVKGKEKQLGRLQQQLELSELARTDFERQYLELQEQQKQENQPSAKLKVPETTSNVERRTTSAIKIRWSKGRRAPCKMSASNSAVHLDSTVYIKSPGEEIYAYSENTLAWSKYASCPVSDCPLVIVGTLLTIVGGCNDEKCTNKLLSLVEEDRERKWSQEFPDMPTKRHGSAALCAGIALVVAGGIGEHDSVLSVVEVLNTETYQWSKATNLPTPLLNSLATVCDDQLYMLGGEDERSEPTNLVYTCKLSTLLKSTNPKSTPGRFKGTLKRSNKTKVWTQVANLPVVYSSCTFLHGCLLAVGGRDSDLKPTMAIRAYAPTTNTWEVISHMTTPRYSCFTTVLSDSKLMVVGGVKDKAQTRTDTVEMGSVFKLIFS